MYEAECPYCKADVDIDHDDGYGFQEDELYQQECPECEKTFTYTTSISYYHETHRADCLNGSHHKYKLDTSEPIPWSKMICSECEKERDLTDSEKRMYGIPTFEEWRRKLQKS